MSYFDTVHWYNMIEQISTSLHALADAQKEANSLAEEANQIAKERLEIEKDKEEWH